METKALVDHETLSLALETLKSLGAVDVRVTTTQDLNAGSYTLTLTASGVATFSIQSQASGFVVGSLLTKLPVLALALNAVPAYIADVTLDLTLTTVGAIFGGSSIVLTYTNSL